MPATTSPRTLPAPHDTARVVPAEIDLVLLDLDGLTRHWRDTGAREGERRAGLPRGTLDIAYQIPEYHLAQLGVLTDEQWAAAVHDRLTTTYGPRASAAIAPWRADRGEIDTTMLDLITGIRAHVPVAVLSNTTSALAADLALHGITDAFDAVFTSAQLGVRKPSPAVYRAVCDAMNVHPHQVFFCDDEEIHIHGARHTGMHAELFTTPQRLARTLAGLGIPVATATTAPSSTAA